MKMKKFKYGSGLSFEHKGNWYKTYIEVEVELDPKDIPDECVKASKEWVTKKIQKEIDEIIED